MTAVWQEMSAGGKALVLLGWALLLVAFGLSVYAVSEIGHFEEDVPDEIDDLKPYEDLVDWLDDHHDDVMEVVHDVLHPDNMDSEKVNNEVAKLEKDSGYTLEVLDIDGVRQYPKYDRNATVLYDDPQLGEYAQANKPSQPLSCLPFPHYFAPSSIHNYLMYLYDVDHDASTTNLTGIQIQVNQNDNNSFQLVDAMKPDTTLKQLWEAVKANENLASLFKPTINGNNVNSVINTNNRIKFTFTNTETIPIEIEIKEPESLPEMSLQDRENNDGTATFVASEGVVGFLEEPPLITAAPQRLPPAHMLKAMLSKDGRGVSMRKVPEMNERRLSVAERIHPDNTHVNEHVGYIVVSKCIPV